MNAAESWKMVLDMERANRDVCYLAKVKNPKELVALWCRANDDLDVAHRIQKLVIKETDPETACEMVKLVYDAANMATIVLKNMLEIMETEKLLKVE